MFVRRHSLFPLVIIFLSLVLAGFMFWTFQDKPSAEEESVIVISEVDVEAYQDALTELLFVFSEAQSAAENDIEVLLAAQTALSQLLDLRVPSEFKQLHLELAVVFSQMQTSLQNHESDISAPLQRLSELQSLYSWL